MHVRFERGDGVEDEVTARCAILTVPAYVARSLLTDLPDDAAHALEAIVYGPFVVGGIVTAETGPMPWDDLYSVLVVGKCFNMLFNHANVLRSPGAPREPGGTLMVYGGGNLARRLFEKSDDEIREAIVSDLYDLYPESTGVVEEVIVQRWDRAIPFAGPVVTSFSPPSNAGSGTYSSRATMSASGRTWSRRRSRRSRRSQRCAGNWRAD